MFISLSPIGAGALDDFLSDENDFASQLQRENDEEAERARLKVSPPSAQPLKPLRQVRIERERA